MASKGWNWGLNPGRLAPEPVLLIVEFRFIFSSVSVCVCVCVYVCVYVWWGLGRNKPGEEMRPGEITLGSKCYVKK